MNYTFLLQLIGNGEFIIMNYTFFIINYPCTIFLKTAQPLIATLRVPMEHAPLPSFLIQQNPAQPRQD